MIELPKIPHADVKLNEQGRVEIKMEDGWCFYMGDVFPEDTPLSEIPKGIGGAFSPDTDFSTFVVIRESEIPEPAPEEATPETPIDEEATEADYINALEELGVSFDE